MPFSCLKRLAAPSLPNCDWLLVMQSVRVRDVKVQGPFSLRRYRTPILFRWQINSPIFFRFGHFPTDLRGRLHEVDEE